jgi:hypothetical protein
MKQIHFYELLTASTQAHWLRSTVQGTDQPEKQCQVNKKNLNKRDYQTLV